LIGGLPMLGRLNLADCCRESYDLGIMLIEARILRRISIAIAVEKINALFNSGTASATDET
jgi:hypothetical protein